MISPQHLSGWKRPCVCAFGGFDQRAAITALSILMFVQMAPGQTTNWKAGTADWFNTANWTAGIPTASLSAFITNGGTAQIGGGAAVALGVTVDAGTIDQMAGQLSAATEFVGQSAVSNFIQSGGTNSVTTLDLWNGTYQISAGNLTDHRK